MAKPVIISPDLLKTHFPGYNPAKSSYFHSESAGLADKWFEHAVKKIPVSVILLSGGAASGKTEYLSEYQKYITDGGIFYDGTLPSLKGAQIKIKAAKNSDRLVSIHFVYPNSLSRAFIAFLGRIRQYSDTHFYRTHSSSRKVILEILEADLAEVVVIKSSYMEKTGNMVFERQEFKSLKHQIDFLRSIQYSEDEIVNIVTGTLDE